jgi:hypothetical protein
MGGTAVTTYPVASTSLSLKWREQYASQALNRYGRAALGRGVVRGFIPSPGAGDRQITLGIDPVVGDSVLLGAGAPSSDGEAPAYREVAPVVLDLSTHMALSAVRYLAFILDYTPTIATTAQFRLYTQAEYDALVIEADGGVVICKITAPGVAGPITDIDTSMRDEQWKWQSHGEDPAGDEILLFNWQPHSEVDYRRSFFGGSLDGLDGGSTTLNAQIGDRCLSFSTLGAPEPGTANIPLLTRTAVRAGERLALRVRYRFGPLTGPPAAVVAFTFYQANSSSIVSTVNVALPLIAGDQFYEGQVLVPANAALVAAALNLTLYDADSNFFYLSSLMITGQRALSDRAGAPDSAARHSIAPPVITSRMLLLDPTSPSQGAYLSADGDGDLYLVAGGSAPAISLDTPDVNTLMTIYLKGTLLVGYVSAVAGDPDVYYAASDSTVGTRRILWKHKDFAGASYTGNLASYEGSMELVSGGLWDNANNRWSYDYAGPDIARLSVTPDGLSLYTLDQSQFPGVNATDANATRPLYIPTLSRLATEDPAGKATPKLAFDVGTTAARANLISQVRQGTTGAAAREYVFGGGALTATEKRSVVNLVYNHGTTNFSADTAVAAGTFVTQDALNIKWALIDGTTNPLPVANGVYTASLNYTLSGGAPTLLFSKDGAHPYGSAIRSGDADLRMDFGLAAAQSLATSHADSTNPDPTTALINTLRAKNVVKAWGIIDLPVALATPEPLFDGFNASSVTNAAGTLVVSLAAGMATAGKFAVIATHDGTGGTPYACTAAPSGTGAILITLYPMGSGTPTAAQSAAGKVSFTVLGVQ